MSDRTRTAVAFLIIVAVLFIWSMMSRKPHTEPSASDTPSDTTTQEVAPEPVVETRELPADADTIVIQRAHYTVVLSSAGGSVKAFYLKDHNINIVPPGEQLFTTIVNSGSIENFDYTVTEDSVVFSYPGKQFALHKTYYFDNQHGFQLSVTAAETASHVLSLKAGLNITEAKNPGEDVRYFSAYVKNDKVNEVKKKIKDEYAYTGDVDWFALRTKYFMLIMNNKARINTINFYKLPKDLPSETACIAPDEVNHAAFGCFYMRGGGDRYGAEIVGTDSIRLSVLLVPIKYSELSKFKRGYEQVTAGGLFGPIQRFFLWVFNFFFSIFKNYGVAIILFAILIKLIFFPLSRQMIMSQRKMQMLQPELKKIQQKYKDEPQRLNQEMMHLYKTYKVNPFTSCLPLLIQMPIFIALYQTLITSIEFRQASFMLWITDLSLKDPYYVLPICMGVMMLVQSLLTTIDPRQRFMVIVMPLVMVFIFLNFPSGLQLYWFSYNILTLIEHIIIKRGGLK
jgi:YidC/Oxa1 family membrane protein insertase